VSTSASASVHSAPWERQAGEWARAHVAFRLFRDLSPAERRIETVAEQTQMSERQVRAWAARWDWRDRAEAWDDERYRIEDQERLDAIRQMHANHRQAGRAAMFKALQALNTLDPTAMPAGAVARLLELGARLERNTLLVSVEELQGVEEDEAAEDPWERIARELDPDAGG
jgi:hypothetical protein